MLNVAIVHEHFVFGITVHLWKWHSKEVNYTVQKDQEKKQKGQKKGRNEGRERVRKGKGGSKSWLWLTVQGYAP